MAQGIVFCHGHTQKLNPLFANSGTNWTLLDWNPKNQPDIVADARDPSIVPLLGAAQYDVVVMQYCTLKKFDDLIKMLRNAYALLKNGGTVYVVGGPGILITRFSYGYDNIKHNKLPHFKIGQEGYSIMQMWLNTLHNTKYENMNIAGRRLMIIRTYKQNTDVIITNLVNQTIEDVRQIVGFSTSGLVPQIPKAMAYIK